MDGSKSTRIIVSEELSSVPVDAYILNRSNIVSSEPDPSDCSVLSLREIFVIIASCLLICFERKRNQQQRDRSEKLE